MNVEGIGNGFDDGDFVFVCCWCLLVYFWFICSLYRYLQIKDGDAINSVVSISGRQAKTKHIVYMKVNETRDVSEFTSAQEWQAKGVIRADWHNGLMPFVTSWKQRDAMHVALYRK